MEKMPKEEEEKILTCMFPIKSAKRRSPEIAIRIEKITSPG